MMVRAENDNKQNTETKELETGGTVPCTKIAVGSGGSQAGLKRERGGEPDPRAFGAAYVAAANQSPLTALAAASRVSPISVSHRPPRLFALSPGSSPHLCLVQLLSTAEDLHLHFLGDTLTL